MFCRLETDQIPLAKVGQILVPLQSEVGRQCSKSLREIVHIPHEEEYTMGMQVFGLSGLTDGQSTRHWFITSQPPQAWEVLHVTSVS